MPKAKPAPDIAAGQLARYDRLIATQPGLQRKGATIPYTSVNGDATMLHEAYGRVMRDWVTVPDALLADTDRLAPHFAASLAYVAAQKPKPTRRKD